MNNYYTAITVINIFALFVIKLCASNSNTLSESRKRLFNWLFSTIILASFCEWAGELFNILGPSTKYIHIVVKFIELSIAPLLGFIFAWVIQKKNEKYIHLFATIHMFIELVSGFTGFIYYVDNAGIYHHGNFYFIYVIAYVISIIYAMVVVFQNINKYQFNGTIFFLLLVCFLLVGVSIQIIDNSLKLSYVSLTMTSIMLYVFTIEMIQQTDELTGLLNRRGYENYLSRLDRNAIIIFFDVDKFKDINDTFGHKYGDEALKKTGKLIFKNYAKSGKCFRYGGDEFCVALTNDLDRIEELNHNFFMDVQDARESDDKMPIISVGFAPYDPVSQNIQDVVTEADQMMYKYKNIRGKSVDKE